MALRASARPASVPSCSGSTGCGTGRVQAWWRQCASVFCGLTPLEALAMNRTNPDRVAGFRLGRIVTTAGARDAMARSGESPDPLLVRHVAGDWGDVSPEAAVENDIAVQQGRRVLS